MKLDDYLEKSSRTFTAPEHFSKSQIEELHCIMGLGTEVGELTDAYKRHLFYGTKLDNVNVEEEMGDVLWYLANLMRLKGVDPEKVMQLNIDKLKARYPEKFDSDKAVNRDLENEREILEGKK